MRGIGGVLAGPFHTLASAMRNANVRRLGLAWAGSRSSEWAFQVILGLFAYQAGGTVAVGVVGFVRMVPAAFASLVCTTFADRYPREGVLRATEAVRAVLAAAAAVAAFAGAPAAAVYVIAALHAIVSSVQLPSVLALLPSLVQTPDELVAANAAILTVQGLGTLIGPVVGGILVATAGVGTALAAVAAAGLVATVLLFALRVEGGALRTATTGRGLREAFAGFAIVARSPAPRLLVSLFGAQTLVRGALTVLTVVLALATLDLDQSWVGFLTAALGAGGLLGASAAGRLAGRNLAGPFLLGLTVWGAPLVVIAGHPAALLALVALVVVGLGDGVLDVSGYTLLQRVVPDDVLARVFGMHNAVTLATIGLGSLVTPALVDVLGTRGTFVAAGALLPVLATLMAARVRAIDRGSARPLHELDLVRRVPMLAGLSVAACEQVASRLVALTFSAGATIVREGETGDRFYILDDGELELERDGKLIVVTGRGEYFGEIALLRDVPRTATVVARTDARLYALERADFVAAVAGHAAGAAAGHAVVEERLPSSLKPPG